MRQKYNKRVNLIMNKDQGKKRQHKIRMEFSKFRGKYGLRILNCTRSRIRSRT